MLLTSWFHLFQTCVIYQLEDGRIVYQHGASKFSNIGPCSRSIKHLQSMIWETFLQKGRVMCCQSNGCNGGIPREIMENDHNKDVFIEKYYESFSREFHHQLSYHEEGTNDLGIPSLLRIVLHAPVPTPEIGPTIIPGLTGIHLALGDVVPIVLCHVIWHISSNK